MKTKKMCEGCKGDIMLNKTQHTPVNSHEALLDALKWLLATAPKDNYDIGYQEARQASAKAIRQAEDK